MRGNKESDVVKRGNELVVANDEAGGKGGRGKRKDGGTGRKKST